MTVSFVGRANRGVEWLAAAELELCGARVTHVEHRAVWFEFSAAPKSSVLSGLRTLDDVFLPVAQLPDVPRDRSGLKTLGSFEADLDRLAARLGQWRPVSTRTFTVVASALGKHNYGRYEMEAAVGAALERRGWRFEDSRLGTAASDRLSLRLHVAGGAFLAARVFHAPLHRRAYRSETHVGALRPPVAAAMALLADQRAGELALDPFCGSGTIPIELALRSPGAGVIASDVEGSHVESARQNAARAGVDVQFRVAAVQQLGLDGASVHALVTNPPWDQKVELRGAASGSDWLTPLARALRSDARAVVLSADPASTERAALRAGYRVALAFQLSLFGSFPSISCLSRSGQDFFREGPVGEALRRNHALHASAAVSTAR